MQRFRHHMSGEQEGGIKPVLMFTLALVLVASVAIPALASHGLASLAGSNFEIDDDANLKLDHAAPSVDWGSLAHNAANETLPTDDPEQRATDAPTGQNDDSYKGGVKEDTECPGETTGSIPNNKSDLLTFHVYEEPGTGTHPGFLNIAWSRVSDPSGTTLMDFEFNQSTTACSTGPNVVRTEGDLLIEYAITQGGARADISGRFWNGSAWGPSQDLDTGTACGGGPCAVGTINQTAIPAGEADGLGAKQPRTFGEAQIDLRLIFDEDECESFGSAMLKSRSSDSFTSQLKDFISPIPIDLQNCGNVIIRKQTNPDEDPNTTEFGYTKAFNTDPSSSNTFTLTDDGVQDYNDTVLFGSGYTVTEDVIPTGWEFVSLDCSASTGVTPQINGATVTFAIDAAGDELDCTYTNRKQLGAIQVTKTRKHQAAAGTGPVAHPGVTFTFKTAGGTTVGTGVTNAQGIACVENLPWGNYTVTETVPTGYAADGLVTKSVTVDQNGTCASGAETVSFSNTPLTDVTVSVDSLVEGGTRSRIRCTDANGAEVVNILTNATSGDGSTTLSNLLPTDPDVTTLPDVVTVTCYITVDP